MAVPERAGWIARLPLHTFMTALLVPLNMAAPNLALFDATDVLHPWGLLTALATLLLLVLRTFLNTASAAVVATAILGGLMIPGGGWTAIAAHGAVVVSLALLFRRRPAGERWTGVLNVALLAMVIVPLSTVARASWESSSSPTAPGASPFDSVQDAPQPLPSIVHIVLDGYAGTSALRSTMGFDNSAFVSDLRRLGFVVAPDARAPYNQTLLTMASVFQGEYLAGDQYPLNLGNPARIRRALGSVVTDGPLHRQLRRLGYTLLYTDTGWGFFRYPSDAVVISPRLMPNPLEMHMLERHPLQTLLSGYARLTGSAEYVSSRQHQLTRHALAAQDYRQASRPFFLYQHIIAPHPPFNVLPDGSLTIRWQEAFVGTSDGDHATLGRPDLMRAYREGYLAKIQYINRAALDRVSELVREVPTPKVIFLHGDHGSGSRLFHDDPRRTCLSERMTTMLAVYSDDPELRQAYEQFAAAQPNLVNLYRPLLDATFGTSLGLAPSRSHFARWTSPHAPEVIPEEAIAAACDGV